MVNTIDYSRHRGRTASYPTAPAQIQPGLALSRLLWITKLGPFPPCYTPQPVTRFGQGGCFTTPLSSVDPPQGILSCRLSTAHSDFVSHRARVGRR